MQELNAADYESVLPLINQVEYDTLFARVVIEGKQQGQIYVDQKNDPGAVLIIHHCGMALLCSGDKNRDIVPREVIPRDVVPNMLEPLLSKMEPESKEQALFIYPQSLGELWETSLGNRFQRFTDIQFDPNACFEEKVAQVSALAQDHIMGWRQAMFTFQQTKFEHKLNRSEKLPAGFVLKRIGLEEVKRIKGEVIPSNYWNSAEDFLKDGVGFCVYHGETIISICFAAYISSGKVEFGVETDENYRGQGFGVFTGAALIEYCLENGLEPVWGCAKDANWSSYRLAQKLGFRETMNYPCYSWVKNIDFM